MAPHPSIPVSTTPAESDEEAEDGQDYASVPRDDFRRSLHRGDEVRWNDPDNGLCSSTGTVSSIEYFPENTARIVWVDGAVTEVRLEELS